MTLIGVFLCSIAVGFFKCSLFGVDPFQCFAMGSWGKFGSMLPYGTYYTLISLVMLAVDWFLDRHYIGIATFINLFLTGYIVDFSQKTLAGLCPEPGLPLRLVFLAVGVVLMCFAASLYMTADLGVSVYDAIPIIISNRTGWPFKFMRISTDLICVAIGTLCVLAGATGAPLPGLGTIITAFFMGPLVDFFNRRFSEPLLESSRSTEVEAV
jgi:uncharacterized membrane protein YczE